MFRFGPFALSVAWYALACAPLCAVARQSPAPATTESAPRLPTNEDLRHFRSMSAPLLSPDGKQVLFAVTQSTVEGAGSHLWLVAVQPDGEKARQLTFSPPSDKRGEHDAQWAPDGSAVFFLAKREDHTQLFRLDLRGGDASPYDLKVIPPVDVSKDKDAINPPPSGNAPEKKEEQRPADQKTETQPLDIAGFALSQDGRYLAVWARDPETPGEKKQKEAKVDASWINHERHLTRLYLAVLKPNASIDGELKPVAIPPDVHRAAWSPVADRLLVFAEVPNDASDLGPANAAWILDASDPEHPVKLDRVPATAQGGAWSNDGVSIVYAAATPDDAPPGYDELYLLKCTTPGTSSLRLTSGFNGQLRDPSLYFIPGGTLIATAGIGTRVTPILIALDAGTAPAQIDFGADVISGLHTNRSQSGWVWLAESGGHPAKLCYAPRVGQNCRALPVPVLDPENMRSIAPLLVRWKSGDFSIEGLLYLPPGGAAAKVPLVVDVHGGPFGAWINRRDPFVDFLLGHGWAVLRPNPRGSSNYGVKFAAANKNDLGGGDYQDIMAGVNYVLANYPIDPARLALMGYSYGGEMAAFVEGKTDRFKAIISGAPVIDQFSEYGTEKGSWYDRWYFGKPWENMQDAWRQSPLAGAAHAKTPFLLIQGQSDSTDPLGQAQEMYRALRQEGAPVELVTYPREDHGPLVNGLLGHPSPEPWHGFDVRQRIVQFIEAAFASSSPSAAQARP